jgi:hypothetical protein
VVTLLALALARYQVDEFDITDPNAVDAAHSGLLGADAAWYLSLAEHGYRGTAEAGLRFFPLFPGAARGLHTVTAIPEGGALVLLANLCALLATMLLVILVGHETRDRALAQRVAWLFSLMPSAFAYVMGYAEAMFVLLAVATFLALRRRSFWWAALWALLAALTRPVGLLLVVPVVVEGVRGWRDASTPSKLGRVVATIAPVAGTTSFLTWVAIEYEDFFAPIRLHREGLDSSVSWNPVVNAYRDLSDLIDGSRIGTGLHLPWVAVALALCFVAFRRLPLSYGCFALTAVLAALAGANFESFERYAFSAFPLVIAASTMTRSRRVEIPVLVLSAVALFGYAFLAFQGAYVP